MNWQSLLDPEIRKFIKEHETQDVSALALKKPPKPSWDYKLILDQIKSRQKAAKKIPLWCTHHADIIFPSANTLEQASSGATARFKASLVQGKTFVDLTGGAGVDCYALTEYFQQGVCIEQDEHGAKLIEHNMKLLTSKPIETLCEKAENYIQNMDHTDLVIIDPQRRDLDQKGKFRFEDCSPNIIDMLTLLRKKADHILIKTSPMMDLSQAIEQLETVQDVYCVQYEKDCKELLFLLRKPPTTNPKIHAVEIDKNGNLITNLSFFQKDERDTDIEYSKPNQYLYEPGPAFQKSGGFKTLAKQFGLKKLHPHTHLYTTDILVRNFPGRPFEILAQYPVKTSKIPLKKANLAIRNFPSTVEKLRKKLNIREGGNEYLFACTLHDESKKILQCRKI